MFEEMLNVDGWRDKRGENCLVFSMQLKLENSVEDKWYRTYSLNFISQSIAEVIKGV